MLDRLECKLLSSRPTMKKLAAKFFFIKKKKNPFPYWLRAQNKKNVRSAILKVEEENQLTDFW